MNSSSVLPSTNSFFEFSCRNRNQPWKEPHVAISAWCMKNEAATPLGTSEPVVLPWWAPGKQQAKPSGLLHWWGRKRRPSKEASSPTQTSPTGNRRTGKHRRAGGAEGTRLKKCQAQKYRKKERKPSSEQQLSRMKEDDSTPAPWSANYVINIGYGAPRKVWSLELPRVFLPPFYKIGILIKCASF